MTIERVSRANPTRTVSYPRGGHKGSRPGLTLDQFKAIRARLREETIRLREEVAQATLQVNDQSNVTLRDGSDEIDDGVLRANLSAEAELADVCGELLAQSLHALSRLEAGTYGICELCHEPIAAGRLLALPRATTCVGCQARASRRTADG